jgi:hypothetical protein
MRLLEARHAGYDFVTDRLARIIAMRSCSNRGLPVERLLEDKAQNLDAPV